MVSGSSPWCPRPPAPSWPPRGRPPPRLPRPLGAAAVVVVAAAAAVAPCWGRGGSGTAWQTRKWSEFQPEERILPSPNKSMRYGETRMESQAKKKQKKMSLLNIYIWQNALVAKEGKTLLTTCRAPDRLPPWPAARPGRATATARTTCPAAGPRRAGAGSAGRRAGAGTGGRWCPGDGCGGLRDGLYKGKMILKKCRENRNSTLPFQTSNLLLLRYKLALKP